MKKFVLLLSLTMLCACTQSPYDFPVPITLPDGSRGFGMTGYVQFTSSEEKAKQEITESFVYACNGAAKITHLEMWNADSLGGVSHIGYHATAQCLDKVRPAGKPR